MKIYVATDHRGVEIEDKIVNYLNEIGMDVERSKLKHYDTDDYTDFAFDIGKKVVSDPDSLGILICGTGIGMSIAANKVKGIRAARCIDVNDAFYSKNHNAANILCLSTEISIEKMFEIIDTFIHTKNPKEEKHLRRVEKIINYEKGE